LDDANFRRRIRVSNYARTTRVTTLMCSMPLCLSPGWNHVNFDLAQFTRRAFGTEYAETVRVQVHANCRLRRVYFADRAYADDELPVEYRLLPQQRPARAAKPAPGRRGAPAAAAASTTVPRTPWPSETSVVFGEHEAHGENHRRDENHRHDEHAAHGENHRQDENHWHDENHRHDDHAAHGENHRHDDHVAAHIMSNGDRRGGGGKSDRRDARTDGSWQSQSSRSDYNMLSTIAMNEWRSPSAETDYDSNVGSRSSADSTRVGTRHAGAGTPTDNN